MYQRVESGLFMRTIDHVRRISHQGGKAGGVNDLEVHDFSFYEASACYLHTDGLSGYVIKQPDAWLCSVFSAVRGRGNSLVESAKQNGTIRLGCFVEHDENKEICGHLYNLYTRNGFVIDTNFSDEDEGWVCRNGVSHGKICGRPAVVMIVQERHGEILENWNSLL